MDTETGARLPVATAAQGRGAVILIVEDNRLQAELLRRTVETAGYATILARNGAEGLALAEAQRPAAILSDVAMPVMDGFTLCHRLRQDQALRDTPVILLTALADAQDVVDGLNAGADCYVTKPYDAQVLLARLAGLLADPPRRDEVPLDLEANVNGTPQQVHAQARQILNLLVSTYTDAVLQQRQLQAAQDMLAESNARLDELVRERTRELERAVAELAFEVDRRKHLQEELQQSNAMLTDSVTRMKLQNALLEAFDKMVNRLQECHSVEEICEVVPHAMQRLFPAFPGTLSLVDKSGQSIDVVANWGGAQVGQRAWSQASCRALRGTRLHIAGGADRDRRCSRACGAPGAADFCMPIKENGETLGLLRLQGNPTDAAGANETNSVTGHETLIRMLDAAGQTIGLSISNLRLQESLRQQSLRDPLTGLYNRRFLAETLEREAARSHRTGQPLGVIMLDIDHFKRINDAHGHVFGDAVLKWLGEFLRGSVRGEDTACRYGGEEFILLLPGSNLEYTVRRAEQIRVGVEAGSKQGFRGPTICQITVSLGVAVMTADATGIASATDMVRRVDEALYLAKQQGRNRLVSADGACGNGRGVPDAGSGVDPAG